MKTNGPLVSVVVPCFNHADYLPKAIESVLRQTYPRTEIVVVDDGSSDHTKAVAERYAEVKYVYQHNQGLSAARNTGVRQSTGEFLLFLDADDWLYPKALEVNVSHLLENKEIAFVSGLYNAVYVDRNVIRDGGYVVESDHYCRLLQGNYIGMVATVLFQRWVFKEFEFDVTLQSCEDYDLYLKVAKKYPVHHHTEKIAAYRQHATNMSANVPVMLKSALQVLKRHEDVLTTTTERKAYLIGNKYWKDYYALEIYKKLRGKKIPATKETLFTLAKHRPVLYAKYLIASFL